MSDTKVNPLRNLSKDLIDKIEANYQEGKTPEQIGIQFGLDFDDIRFYCENFIVPPRSRFERLEELTDDLEEVLGQTKRDLDLSSGNQAMLVASYQKLASEYRIAISELDDLQKPEDVVTDMVEKVLNPFIRDLVRSCTEETAKLQEELLKIDVPTRDAKGISLDIFQRLAERIRNNLTPAISALNDYHGVKKEKNTKDEAFFKENLLQ